MFSHCYHLVNKGLNKPIQSSMGSEIKTNVIKVFFCVNLFIPLTLSIFQDKCTVYTLRLVLHLSCL